MWTEEDLAAISEAARQGRELREAVLAGKIPEAVAVAAISRPVGKENKFELVPKGSNAAEAASASLEDNPFA